MVKDNQSKRRKIKKTETVRQKRTKQSENQPKHRQFNQKASSSNRFLQFIFRGLSKIFKPFKFLVWPFTTRPVRFIARVIYKILGIGYFVNSWKELRLVEWPKRGETAQLTVAVFIFAFAIAGFIAVLDYGLDKVFKQLLT